MKDYKDNIFTKIIDKKLSENILHETTYTMVILDIKPRAKHHYLIVPKGKYTNLVHFLTDAPSEEKIDFQTTYLHLVKNNPHSIESNIGRNQEVGHFHIHVLIDQLR